MALRVSRSRWCVGWGGGFHGRVKLEMIEKSDLALRFLFFFLLLVFLESIYFSSSCCSHILPLVSRLLFASKPLLVSNFLIVRPQFLLLGLQFLLVTPPILLVTFPPNSSC